MFAFVLVVTMILFLFVNCGVSSKMENYLSSRCQYSCFASHETVRAQKIQGKRHQATKKLNKKRGNK